MSRRTAWKLCSQAEILSSAQRRRRGKGKKAGPPVFDDHVQRQFRADAPNRLWLTDITEHWTNEGKLYCCASKDAHSNRIVGYSIDDRMTSKLAIDALRNAVARRRDVAGCILHADRGSQFRSRAMARELRRHDMVGSMGRVGAAGDNAAMESFWSLLQTNVLNQQCWGSRQDLRLAIVVWIERKYHRQRAQDTLGGLTPIEFEAKLTRRRSRLSRRRELRCRRDGCVRRWRNGGRRIRAGCRASSPVRPREPRDCHARECASHRRRECARPSSRRCGPYGRGARR